MSFRPKIKNKILAVLFAILPAFVVGSLVFGANVYFDLDADTGAGRIMMNQNSEIVGVLTVTGNSTSSSASITQAGTGNGVSIDQNGNVGTTVSTDGALFVDNTGNTDIGLNVYSNIGATSAAGLVYFTADDTGFDQTVLTVRQDGTGNIMDLTGDSIAVGSGIFLSVDGLTTGSGIAVDSSSTAFSGKLLNLTASGAANATTRYGVYSSLTGAGTTSTNIAGYFSASGATNNYGLIVENGNVGIGTTGPNQLLHLSKEGDAAINFEVVALNNPVIGPNNGGAFADDSSVGAAVWSNPSDAQTSNDTYADAGMTAGMISHYLKATDFSFTVPTGATISGILVEIEKRKFGSGMKDYSVKIVKGGTISGDDKADTVNQWPDSDAYSSYGGSSNLWGLTWSSADINASNFGIAISSICDTSNAFAYIDHIRITVYYQEATVNWALGGDKSDSGKFKLSYGSSLGTNDYLTIDTSGNMGIGAANPSSKLDISQNSSSTALTVTQSGTGNIVNLTGDSITTGTGLALSVDGLTTGSGIAVDSSSTVFSGKLLNLTASGALGSAGTVYGVYSALTGANANNTNVAGYFSASGAGSANYGLIVENGNVGIGDTTPTALFTVGSGDLFKVDSSGTITAVVGITNSGNLTFSGATPVISASTDATDISLDAGTTGKVKIGGTSTGDIDFAGGSTSTGCTITTAGVLTCSGNITGPATGTVGYWERNDGTSTLSQAADNDNLALGSGTITTTGTITSGLINSQTISATASFTGTVGITGATTLTGLLTANGGITADSGVFTVADTTGALHTAGDFDVATNKFTVASATGNTLIAGTLGITGLTTMTGGFDSNTASTVAGLTVDDNGNLSIASGTGTFSMAGYSGTGDAASIVSSSTTNVNKAVNISQTGATAGTDYGLYVSNTGAGTTNIGGYFSASGAGSANYGLIVENGNVGVGTTTPSSLLTISSTGDFAIGDYNAVLIDDMEVITDWVAIDGANTPVALESAVVRKGSGAMKITTSATAANSLNDTIKKTFGANQNYSTYERIGFWIKATQTGQNISFAFNDTVAGTSTYAITIVEANQWQYEEYNISGITDTSRDVVDWVQFLINTYTDSSNPTFYIDQARVYDYDERTSEMFVDADGNLIVWGRGGIELGRGVPGSSLAGLKIGSANIEINQPLNVNVAGDTGMAYDLQFLNTGGANITSQGALTISAGDPNKTQNLTLTTQANQMSGDSGISTGSSDITLIDTTKSALWIADEWVGGTVTIIGGPGAGQAQDITANTTTTITVADWTGTALDTTVANSIYHLAYAKGGDTVIDIQNSDIVYGGFKIAGVDEGGYVFRVSPDGNVEIGGNGSAGSNLVVKQNLSLTGGNITVSKLSIASAGTPALSENADQTGSANSGCSDATAFYYKVTALNDNGETTGSTEATITTGAASGTYANDDTITITWTAVSGATKYKIHRSVDQTWDAGANDYWVDKKYITSPAIILIDNCQTGDDTASDAPPSTNTTGGKIAINTSNPTRNLEVFENTSTDPQMRLVSDVAGNKYSEFYTDLTGDLTISATGGDIKILSENLWVCSGAGCPSVTLSAGGNLLVENTVYADKFDKCWRDDDSDGVSDWITVPGNQKFGTDDFCVMKYEAKCAIADGQTCNDASDTPVSKTANLPWRATVDQTEAIANCARIGSGYHLMTEAEWMTIAYNITQTVINDLDSDPGLQLGNGNSTSAAPYAAVADPVISTCDLNINLENAANAWSATCQLRGTSGATADFGYTHDGASNFSIAYNTGADSKAHIRTHVLSNGEIIWDIAGNVWEWTNATVLSSNEPHDGTAVDGEWTNYFVAEASYSPISNWGVLDDLSTIVGSGQMFAHSPYSTAGAKTFAEIIKPIEFDPYNLDVQLRADNNGIGRLYSDAGDPSPATHAFIHGGNWGHDASAGVFTLGLSNVPSYSFPTLGFRCAR